MSFKFASMINPHSATWLALNDLGSVYPDYAQTISFPKLYIDEFHASLASSPTRGPLLDVGREGLLRKADALKLYEMAFFASGKVLEIGCYKGLSTWIQANALANSDAPSQMTVLEYREDYAQAAIKNLGPLADRCKFIIGDARKTTKTLVGEGSKFNFIFVDHNHSEEFTRIACKDARILLECGGFILFHDFNDPRNQNDPAYGVFRAVVDEFADGRFQFYGLFGCTALYRYRV